MPKKISKRTRLQAAHLCDIAASTPSTKGAYYTIAEDCGYLHSAVELAYTAWASNDPHGYDAATEARLANLLRCGWSPE